ncbi:hypothetical protein AB0H82_30215 [Streptomyces sp. NPDC050732]|uniref:SCO2400 family protein n=1 Tax=Streptomyces sp. NPDC050732 TaxID=3154632 RepID=UPI003431D54B
MDYCHPCRRHLNGALACPGCGTPAEACREYAQSITAPDEEPAGPRTPHEERPPRTRGRRAHRRRRRKALLITAGLTLAAGGLSLAELGTEGDSGPPTAASAPDHPSPTETTAPGGGTTAEDAAAVSAAPSGTKTPDAERQDDKNGKKKREAPCP